MRTQSNTILTQMTCRSEFALDEVRELVVFDVPVFEQLGVHSSHDVIQALIYMNIWIPPPDLVSDLSC